MVVTNKRNEKVEKERMNRKKMEVAMVADLPFTNRKKLMKEGRDESDRIMRSERKKKKVEAKNS